MSEGEHFTPEMLDAEDARDRRERHAAEKLMDQKLDNALALIRAEVRRAIQKHGPMASHHEAYAVIREEFEMEYWPEVCKGGTTPRDAQQLQKELVQTAAMATRALVDLCV